EDREGPGDPWHRGQTAAQAQREAVLGLIAGAPPYGDVRLAMDLRQIALVRTCGHCDLVLARQVGILGVAVKKRRQLGDDRADVEWSRLVKARHGAARDVTNRIAASADCAHAHIPQRGEHVRQMIQANRVKLKVLAGSDLAESLAVLLRQMADSPKLRRLQ